MLNYIDFDSVFISGVQVVGFLCWISMLYIFNKNRKDTVIESKDPDWHWSWLFVGIGIPIFMGLLIADLYLEWNVMKPFLIFFQLLISVVCIIWLLFYLYKKFIVRSS